MLSRPWKYKKTGSLHTEPQGAIQRTYTNRPINLNVCHRDSQSLERFFRASPPLRWSLFISSSFLLCARGPAYTAMQTSWCMGAVDITHILHSKATWWGQGHGQAFGTVRLCQRWEMIMVCELLRRFFATDPHIIYSVFRSSRLRGNVVSHITNNY